MTRLDEQFRINLNQNLWGLVLAFGALGAAEYFNLQTLYWFEFVANIVMALSVAAMTLAYTINYCRTKMLKGRDARDV